MSTPVEISDARRVAFAGLIDYAGLFPPASLDMAGAVSGYREARASSHGWVADRFIVPASRLVELAGELTPSMAADEEPWRISAIADLGEFPRFVETVSAIAAFGDEMSSAAPVELVEAKLDPGVDEMAVGDAAVAIGRTGAVPFFEPPPDELPLDELTAARRQRDLALGAKLRCGGVTADLFPDPERVAAFISGCVERALPFKCTAGLHHPVRHTDPDTGFTHHGFLNVAAASLAAQTLGPEELVGIISDTDPHSFAVTRSGLSWRGMTFDSAAVAASRSGGFVAYGSCDFDEPIADLVELGMLP